MPSATRAGRYFRPRTPSKDNLWTVGAQAHREKLLRPDLLLFEVRGPKRDLEDLERSDFSVKRETSYL